MTKKIRIAFDANPLLAAKTGVGYYTEQLISELSRQYGTQVSLIGFYFDFLGRKDVAHLPQGPNIAYRPVRWIPDKVVFQALRWGIRPPFELFVRDEVDFILFDNFWGYRSRRHTPAAAVVHDLTYIDTPEYVSAKNRADLQRMIPEQIARSAFVITVSEFSKQRLVDVYGLQPGRILVTPIPARPATRQAADSSALLKEQGVTRPYLLFVGTVEPRKNITTLVAAMQHLPPEFRKTYQLVIAGRMGWNCQNEADVLAKAHEDTNVVHLGYVDDQLKAALYANAALFVSASQYEGFGMPVLEAMSYGTPCAASDIPVFHEVAGEAAAYFNQNDPAAIASVMHSVLSDSRRIQGMRAASLRQAQRFTWPDVARQLYARIQATIR
jgi:glycosyltransferase involved in cell wall biosynthesis